MKWGVVRFPGSLDDGDAIHALADVMGQDARILWHKDESLDGVECVLLLGVPQHGFERLQIGVDVGDDRDPHSRARDRARHPARVRRAGGGAFGQPVRPCLANHGGACANGPCGAD